MPAISAIHTVQDKRGSGSRLNRSPPDVTGLASRELLPTPGSWSGLAPGPVGCAGSEWSGRGGGGVVCSACAVTAALLRRRTDTQASAPARPGQGPSRPRHDPAHRPGNRAPAQPAPPAQQRRALAGLAAPPPGPRWWLGRGKLIAAALCGMLEVSPGGPPDDGSPGFALSQGSQARLNLSTENAAASCFQCVSLPVSASDAAPAAMSGSHSRGSSTVGSHGRAGQPGVTGGAAAPRSWPGRGRRVP